MLYTSARGPLDRILLMAVECRVQDGPELRLIVPVWAAWMALWLLKHLQAALRPFQQQGFVNAIDGPSTFEA